MRSSRFRLNDFVVTSLGEAYPDIISIVMEHGYGVESRAGHTMNLKNATIVLLDPHRSLVSRKGMSDAFALEEATQILAGAYDKGRLGRISPRAGEMITALTAYGPRTAAQLLSVESELRANPSSRRGTVYVGREDDLLHSGDDNRSREMPCTKTWQFDLTDGALDMTVEMRSNDVVWGLSYDVPCFTAVQRAMAQALGVPVGVYWHKANSLHIYERHFDIEVSRRTDDVFLGVSDLFGPTIWETQERAVARLRED